MSRISSFCRLSLFLVAAELSCPFLYSQAQSSGSESRRTEIQELREALDNTRAELAQAQRRIEQLASRVATLEASNEKNIEPADRPQSAQAPSRTDPYASPADLARGNEHADQATTTADMTEAERLLAARVEEQHQTKVESVSKYRVKLSGLILMNAFSTRGAVDDISQPNLAEPKTRINGSFGASLRQTILGVQMFGPTIGGARTSADLSVDFFGGLPREPFGTTAGRLRLRTAAAHLNWKHTSVNIGQDAPLFSPLSPTSFATVAEPAMSWAGNLWVWTPQLNVEHRFVASENTFFSVSGGILAPLAADIPESSITTIPGPGERSRRPAFATQFSLHTKLLGHDAVIGVGGYSSRVAYDLGRKTNGWAFTSFWQLPLAHWLELSGEGYRGKAVSGLGGGLWQNIAYNGDPALPSTQSRFLNSLGGWSQVKFRIHPQWELNTAIGQDNVLAKDLEWAPVLSTEYTLPMARNRITFGNLIYRPKSNILFSAEYRKIWTFQYTGNRRTADQINLAAGVSF